MLDGAKDQWSLENRAVVNLSDVQVYLKAEPKVSGRRRLLSGVGRRGSEVHALGEAAPVVRANDFRGEIEDRACRVRHCGAVWR